MRASAASAAETAPDIDRWRSGRRMPPLPAAAQDGFEPGRQGAGAERLRQEVVGAELEHAHFVILVSRSEEHTSELQSQSNLVCRLLLEKKKNIIFGVTIRALAVHAKR